MKIIEDKNGILERDDGKIFGLAYMSRDVDGYILLDGDFTLEELLALVEYMKDRVPQ